MQEEGTANIKGKEEIGNYQVCCISFFSCFTNKKERLGHNLYKQKISLIEQEVKGLQRKKFLKFHSEKAHSNHKSMHPCMSDYISLLSAKNNYVMEFSEDFKYLGKKVPFNYISTSLILMN